MWKHLHWNNPTFRTVHPGLSKLQRNRARKQEEQKEEDEFVDTDLELEGESEGFRLANVSDVVNR